MLGHKKGDQSVALEMEQPSVSMESKSYTCGFCSNKVAPHIGYYATAPINSKDRIYVMICPNCGKPTFLDNQGDQTPNVRIGNEVAGITDEGVKELYNQARDCSSLNAYTATTLLCRKILMNLAVQYGAEPGRAFADYITFLDSKGYVPPNGKNWVDRIRTKGNEATHEIRLIEKNEAIQILKFTEMLLKFAYEFQDMLKEE